MKRSIQIHNIEPVFDSDSRVLILGSFPSVKSREQSFFYGHPQNRFWQVVASVFDCDVPQSIAKKKDMLYKNNIAVWDVIKSCEITGSSDSSIKNVIPNDLDIIFSKCHIEKVFANGKTSYSLYNKHLLKKTGRDIILLPSTSPANAAFSVERLVEKWRQISE